jgi:hypothetical protein
MHTLKENSMKKSLFALLAAIATVGAIPAHAQLAITEVDASGSGASYGADWFELTNKGAAAVTIDSTWKMDDGSAALATAVAFRGTTVINPGQSAIFLEGNATGTTDTTILSNFNLAWFGTSISTLAIGFYGGSGVGLSTTALDGVNVFNPAGTNVASVSFTGAAAGHTFDNAIGNNGTIDGQFSLVGVNGAFLSANGLEIGSPGTIGAVAAVPEPETYAMLLAGLGVIGGIARKRVRQ